MVDLAGPGHSSRAGSFSALPAAVPVGIARLAPARIAHGPPGRGPRKSRSDPRFPGAGTTRHRPTPRNRRGPMSNSRLLSAVFGVLVAAALPAAAQDPADPPPEPGV